MTELNVPQRKRARSDNGSKPNWSKCLCHVRNDNGKLCVFTDKTWNTFESFANQRQDDVFRIMEGCWSEGPKGGYHKRCYQAYTNKDHVARAARKKRKSSSRPAPHVKVTDEPVQKRICRSCTSVTNPEKCVICQKDKFQRSRGPKTRETLCQNMSEQAIKSLHTAARLRSDDRMLIAIQARSIKYHRSCYREYALRRETLAKLEGEESELNKDCDDEYSKAFNAMREYVNDEVIEGFKVVTMSELLQRYLELLSCHGIEAADHRSSKLKNRLKNCFSDRLTFYQPVCQNHSELVFSSDIKNGELVEALLKSTYSRFEREFGGHCDTTRVGSVSKPTTHSTTEPLHVYHTATLIRSLLDDLKSSMPWPPTPEDVGAHNIEIPDLLYNLLAWILCPKLDYCTVKATEVPDNIQRIIFSISQDLIHCASHGRIKTPKHVALPIAVKSLTGSAEVITLLNRLGHGLSYSQVEEIETALAEQEAQRQRDGVILPSVCEPYIPAIFCWNNNDIQEETLSGKGTTHCTNGIVIQRKPLTCAPPPAKLESRPRTKQRSVQSVSAGISPYHSARREGPTPNSAIDVKQVIEACPDDYRSPKSKDLAWMICRQNFRDCPSVVSEDEVSQVVPSWSAFNAILQRENAPRESSVGYCQIIDGSPTELSTVYTILEKSLQMANQLHQHDAIVVFDQAIYAKALEIIWKNQERFQRIVPRLGAFHTICAFSAVIGKRFGEAGLSDILVESGIVGAGSVNGVIQGKHYNRSVRFHKIVFEAMHRIQWQRFKNWLDGSKTEINEVIVIEAIADVRKELCPSTVESLLQLAEFEKICSLYESHCREDNGPLKIFWNSYLEMVALLMNFIRATREGNWLLHLSCIKDMLPWFFAYDHSNYSRYLPLYLMHMVNLKETHPEAYDLLSNGDFGVQRTDRHGFSQVPIDQTIEQTLNRNTKTKGGIIGFSLKKGTVQRWLLTAHSRAAFVDKCRDMAGRRTNGSTTHKECSRTRMKRDEEDMKKVVDAINGFKDPFENSEELVSLSSGCVADETITKDLMEAKERGKAALTSFVQDRLAAGSTGFFDTLPRLKLKTFTNAVKSKAVKTTSREVILKADRNLFARLLVIGQTPDENRKVDIRDLLAHELCPLPWSLAALDGSLAKTNKAVLLKLLEKNVPVLPALPLSTCAIIDAMAVIQAITSVPDRFSTLAERIFDRIVSLAGNDATRIDFVGDQYPVISIKNAERSKRSRDGQIGVEITSSQQRCPRQWKKFLSNGKNKTCLLQFLACEWARDSYIDKLGGRAVYVSHGSLCTRLTAGDGRVLLTAVPELYTEQEEADTRMFLHVLHASNNGHRQLSIYSSDADVEVLACYHQTNIPARIAIVSGTLNYSRIVDIPSVCNQLGEEVCKVLPSLHALTGCDSVSAFSGKGKTKAFKLVKENKQLRELLLPLGHNVPVRDEDAADVEEFVCCIYGKPWKDVNEVRYHLFCKMKNVQSHHLPPTKSALKKHIQRANLQAYIWRNALEANPTAHSPVGNGWLLKDQELIIDWTDQAPAPKAVMELLCCGCKGQCRSQRCSCARSGLPCSDACLCEDSSCINRSSMEDIDGDDSDPEEY